MPEFSHYKGNPNLKAAAVRHSYTEAEIKEFVKCSKDPIYFIQKYVNIVSIDEGLVPFKLYPFQKDLLTARDTIVHTKIKIIFNLLLASNRNGIVCQ